ncbi:MAG: hypothetical protein IK997_02060 [Bacilli bacterium]|nr:hypothetical protein [Bacilli bacterium]
MKKINLVIITFFVIIFFCTGCFNKQENEIENKKNSNLSDSERIEIVNNSEVIFNNDTKEISNLKCNSKNKKVNYTLKLISGELNIINEDNFENYSLKNINSIKQISSITYTSKCDDMVYILLTENGDIYYTNSNIVNFKDIKNIDKEFRKLNTEYKFSDIKVENEVYSNTSSGEIIKLNFR